jgi:hypothetical protein
MSEFGLALENWVNGPDPGLQKNFHLLCNMPVIVVYMYNNIVVQYFCLEKN